MAWLDTANALLLLIGSAISVIVAAISAYFGIKNWIAKNKDKSAKEKWEIVKALLKRAMQEVEASGITGPVNKKEAAIKILNGLADEAGIDISDLTEAVSNFIDSEIAFANTMNSLKKKS